MENEHPEYGALLMRSEVTGNKGLAYAFYGVAMMLFFGTLLLFSVDEVNWLAVATTLGAATLLVLRATGLSRTGHIAVYERGIEGKTRSRKAYSFPKGGDLAAINMDREFLLLSGKSGELLLNDGFPKERHLRGLIFLWLEHELPQAVWGHFREASTKELQTVLRLFLDDGGEPEFMDRGSIIPAGQKFIYLPRQQTVPVPPPDDRPRTRLSTTLAAAPVVMKFDPDPGILPLARLAAAILATPMEEKLRLSCLEMLVEAHGGAFLEKGEGDWTGEMAGRKLQAIPTGED